MPYLVMQYAVSGDGMSQYAVLGNAICDARGYNVVTRHKRTFA